jgi:penicillin-binding protein 1A
VAIQSVEEANGSITKNEIRKERVFPAKVGEVAKDMLGLVVSTGTGKAAQVGDEFIWGKTGTTENYGDAWFVGGNDDLTVAIWVGYADKLQPMEFEHAGSPVAGGTYPAEIFHDFMTSWLDMRTERRLARHANDEDEESGTAPALPVAPTDVPSTDQAAPTETAPADEGGQKAPPAPNQQPQPPAPTPEPPATPAPPTSPPPTEGGGGAGPGGEG